MIWYMVNGRFIGSGCLKCCEVFILITCDGKLGTHPIHLFELLGLQGKTTALAA